MFDRKLKFYMQRSGISSIPELSRRANVPATTLYDLIEGKTSNPTTATVEKLANFFKVSISELVKDHLGVYVSKTSFESIGELLIFLMKDLHLSERELSRRTGILQQTINKIITGKTKAPNDATLSTLANFFGISLDQIQLNSPLDADREKGIYNSHATLASKIPYISWEQLYLLPDALQAPSFGYYRYTMLHSENVFSVDIPTDYDDSSIKPTITRNCQLVVNQEPYQNKDFILCLMPNKVAIGNVILKKAKTVLIPPNLNASPITLIDGEFKYIGKIAKVIKK